MDVEIAEQPGVGLDGQPRPSEDVVVALPNAVVLLDGATSAMPGRGSWYASRLAGHLAGRLTGYPAMDLADLLAASIQAVARENGLVPGESPSSTVALARWSDETVDGLVLAESQVVAVTGDGPQVLADGRLTRADPRESAPVGRLRNTEGGFWVAEADPDAAYHAVRATWPRAEVRQVLLASDGVSRGVDDYEILDWPGVVELVTAKGPQAVLDAVREAETSDPDGSRWPRRQLHDDQALAVVRFD